MPNPPQVFLIEFPTIIINTQNEDLGMPETWTPGKRTIDLSDISGHSSSILYLKGGQEVSGTILRYKNGDKVFVRVPYEDISKVFVNRYTNVHILPYTNYLSVEETTTEQ